MPKADSQKQGWKGHAALRPGLGFFHGYAGDNNEHRHWAHQLSIAQQGDIELFSNDVQFKAPALFIRANTPHKLLPSYVLSVYLDPTSALAQSLCAFIECGDNIVQLSDKTINTLINPTAALDLEQIKAQLQQALRSGMDSPQKSAMNKVLQVLETGIRNEQEPALGALAAIVGVSNSRFSHWFKEQTGMPLRSYRKWLHLMLGLEKALEGYSLTEAAHEARFSDQAHFSRTFTQAFGISPSEVLTQLHAR